LALKTHVYISYSVPRIEFEKSAYSIPEPSAKDQIAMVTVKVNRLGDVSKVANVRCSTRDGSAFSGTDYNPKSLILQFAEGMLLVEPCHDKTNIMRLRPAWIQTRSGSMLFAYQLYYK
jgi:hypothetical protein